MRSGHLASCLPSFLPSVALGLIGRWERISSPSCLLSEPHTQGQDRLRSLGEGRKSAGSPAQVQEVRDEHPSGFCPSLQLRQATNQAWQLWGSGEGPRRGPPCKYHLRSEGVQTETCKEET